MRLILRVRLRLRLRRVHKATHNTCNTAPTALGLHVLWPMIRLGLPAFFK